MKYLLVSFILLFLFISDSFATIINVPADIDSIQGGINLAVDGDTVLVQPGTYVENINFNGKNIIVGSLMLTTLDTSHISQTVIDGDYSGSVVTFENGEDSTSLLSGFTITNGRADYGAGIYILSSSPAVSNMMIRDNDACFGGGIYLNNSNTNINNSTIKSNEGILGYLGFLSGKGGGIYCDNSDLTLINVKIIKNFSISGGGINCQNSNFVVIDAIVSENCVALFSEGGSKGGGGIVFSSSTATLSNVLVNKNINGQFGIGIHGGGISCFDSDLSLSDVKVIENRAIRGGGGGIYFGENSNAVFDPVNRCNIYFNYGNSLVSG